MTDRTASNPHVVSIRQLAAAAPARGPWQEAWGRLIKNRASVTGMIIILFFIFVMIFARSLAPYSPIQMNSGFDYLPPFWVQEASNGKSGSTEFLLGTDTLGRDLLSRVIYGTRVSLVVGFVPTFIIVMVGVFVGMLAGYHGGTWDNLLMRFTDIMYGFPDLLFFIIVLVALRDTWIGDFMNGLFLLFGALAIVNWVAVARVTRGQVLAVKQKEFIEAARCIGANHSRIMLSHIFPNILGPIVVQTSFLIPGMIITEAILGYLGLGLKPVTNPDAFFITSWGSLLLEGQTSVNANPYMLLIPAICVALVVLAFTFIGDGLRDALDPRMRGTQ